MRSIFPLLCIALTVFMTSSLRAYVDEIAPFESDSHRESDYENQLPLGFGWLVERYDFDRIEEYVDEYYIGRYKNWEKFLTTKQRELAGKFGLSDVFVRPDFNCYENTKVALTKRVWDGKLLFRYLAPVGDLKDFELSVALRPYRFVTFLVKGEMNGEQHAVLVINRPFGPGKVSNYKNRNLKRLLEFMKRVAD